MEDVVKAIEQLAEKDIVDYLLIIVPIVVSIVAIVISIATAKKQNKIALFERRFRCVSQIQMIVAFGSSIDSTAKPLLITQLFDAYWGTDISLSKGTLKTIKAKSQLEKIIDDVAQAKFLFNCKYNVEPLDLVKSFHRIIIGAQGDDIPEDLINEFCSLCETFHEKDFPKLKNKIKL